MLPPPPAIDDACMMNNDHLATSASSPVDTYHHRRRHPESLWSGSVSGHSNRPPAYAQQPARIDPHQRNLTWADIEKGVGEARRQSTIEEAATSRSQPLPTFQQSTTSDILSSRGIDKVRSYLLLLGISTSPSPSQFQSAPHQISPAPSLAFVTSFIDLAEAKRSMSSHLYKSLPIRLLAYTILFFNTLLVIKVMADPMYPSSMNGGSLYEDTKQISLGSSEVQTKVSCVFATSHNDEMQAAPFVSLQSNTSQNSTINMQLD